MTREEIIKWLESLKAEIGKSEHRTLWHYAEAIDMAIEALAEPVVRCKDCYYFDEEEFENGDVVLFCNFMSAELNDMEMNNESYCSNGERREP